jgi:hypothetical protein
VTPTGHRVTVYWDAHRLVKGEDWEEGFATGLLNSLCFLPLFSYGATAPLAALPEDCFVQRVREGWGEQPLGRTRLHGRDSDWEDNVLKEFLIAQVRRGMRCASRTAPPAYAGPYRYHGSGVVPRCKPPVTPFAPLEYGNCHGCFVDASDPRARQRVGKEAGSAQAAMWTWSW